MNISRTLTAIVVVLCLVLAFVTFRTTRASDPPSRVTVLASWSGHEESAFRNVLAEFTRRTGTEVDYQGTTAQREVLRADTLAGAAPDIAILSSPGELAEYAQRGELIPLDGILGDVLGADGGEPPAYTEPWVPRLRSAAAVEDGDDAGEVYWVPVKTELKSLLWYDPQTVAPGDLAGLLADGDSWCLGMGSDAPSGWPGTDWVEDLLLQQAGPEVYQAWVTGAEGSWTSQEMVTAWRTWGELLTAGGADRGARSLLTDYGQASAGLFTRPADCALDHMASFGRGAYQGDDGTWRAAYVPSARLLPGTAAEPAGWEVVGDFAAMFRDSPEAAELLRFLASAAAQELWVEQAPDAIPRPLSANQRVRLESYESENAPDPVGRELAEVMQTAQTLCLDASDAMPPTLHEAFRHATLRFAAATGEFLADPARLTGLLDELEQLRRKLTERNAAWLPAVCG
jgi:alpha-glucoside transport system substrate-binding protein